MTSLCPKLSFQLSFKRLYFWQHMKCVIGTVVTEDKSFLEFSVTYIYFFHQLYKVISLKYWISLFMYWFGEVTKKCSFLFSSKYQRFLFHDTFRDSIGEPPGHTHQEKAPITPNLEGGEHVVGDHKIQFCMAGVRAHGVSWSTYLCLWPGENQHSSMVTQTVHQFSGGKKKKEEDVHGSGPLVSCWHGPHSRLFLFGSIPLKRRGAAVQEVSDSHTTSGTISTLQLQHGWCSALSPSVLFSVSSKLISVPGDISRSDVLIFF